ncbi:MULTISPECIES: DUF4402 domain-containing protein [unclassified Flavobacterium]|uniref:DUF4402 domain-containing protein n=1 Tax=unclassified Flavobacterium TaxID=196869 RepID=UPI003F8E40B7
MKKITIIAILAIAAFSNNANAQTDTKATTTTDAKAKLIKVMSLSNTNAKGLDFGTIVLTDGTAGTVTLKTDGSRVYTGSAAQAAAGATQEPQVASYTVSGTPNETYAVTLPSQIDISTTTSATAGGTVTTMKIDNLKARFNGASADATSSKLSTSGADSFVVGGILNIAATQNPGVYTGTYDVAVNYN